MFSTRSGENARLYWRICPCTNLCRADPVPSVFHRGSWLVFVAGLGKSPNFLVVRLGRSLVCSGNLGAAAVSDCRNSCSKKESFSQRNHIG